MESVFETDKKIVIVDCRGMLPPDPMVAVLEAVDSLKVDEAVLMIHRKEPFPLYGKLGPRDCDYLVHRQDNGDVQLLIWKRDEDR